MPLESGMRVSISMPHWMEAAWVSMGFMSVGNGFGLREGRALADCPLASSPWVLVSHRFDHHLAAAQNAVVHPFWTPFVEGWNPPHQ
jgi:hypothetical protein